jgi:hypothetical protein
MAGLAERMLVLIAKKPKTRNSSTNTVTLALIVPSE